MAGQATCSACGAEISAEEGWRAYAPALDRAAAFCRLEHLVPWSMRGGEWDDGPSSLPPGSEHEPRCVACDTPLGDDRVVLVRHRGGYRIADGFCSTDHMVEWAKKGGRWAP
jgi:hypothetical protein